MSGKGLHSGLNVSKTAISHFCFCFCRSIENCSTASGRTGLILQQILTLIH